MTDQEKLQQSIYDNHPEILKIELQRHKALFKVKDQVSKQVSTIYQTQGSMTPDLHPQGIPSFKALKPYIDKIEAQARNQVDQIHKAADQQLAKQKVAIDKEYGFEPLEKRFQEKTHQQSKAQKNRIGTLSEDNQYQYNQFKNQQQKLIREKEASLKQKVDQWGGMKAAQTEMAIQLAEFKSVIQDRIKAKEEQLLNQQEETKQTKKEQRIEAIKQVQVEAKKEEQQKQRFDQKRDLFKDNKQDQLSFQDEKAIKTLQEEQNSTRDRIDLNAQKNQDKIMNKLHEYEDSPHLSESHDRVERLYTNATLNHAFNKLDAEAHFKHQWEEQFPKRSYSETKFDSTHFEKTAQKIRDDGYLVRQKKDSFLEENTRKALRDRLRITERYVQGKSDFLTYRGKLENHKTEHLGALVYNKEACRDIDQKLQQSSPEGILKEKITREKNKLSRGKNQSQQPTNENTLAKKQSMPRP